MEQIARDARCASRVVAKARASVRETAIRSVAARLRAGTAAILRANREDCARAEHDGLAAPLLDRLRLDDQRLAHMASAAEEVAALADPVGAIERTWRRPNGLVVGRMRIPLGVVLMIYEARPNVTTDAFALCLRAGNAVILRAGSEAQATQRALAAAIAAGLDEAGLPPKAAQIVPTSDREIMKALLGMEEHIDLVIPRGGEGLIRFVTEHSRIPVVKHYRGVCHVFVDTHADFDMALAICENAKAQRPGVCNAVETILVHDAIAESFLPRLGERLCAAGVEIRGDDRVRRVLGDTVVPATLEDWTAEYLALVVAVRVVPSLAAAIQHIEKYGSQHTEAIVTADLGAARRFVEEVDSGTVIVNASTRFADGGELGLGAEIGISTSKVHAFGPMGVDGLTTTKLVVFGDGQIRT